MRVMLMIKCTLTFCHLTRLAQIASMYVVPCMQHALGSKYFGGKKDRNASAMSSVGSVEMVQQVL